LTASRAKFTGLTAQTEAFKGRIRLPGSVWARLWARTYVGKKFDSGELVKKELPAKNADFQGYLINTRREKFKDPRVRRRWDSRGFRMDEPAAFLRFVHPCARIFQRQRLTKELPGGRACGVATHPRQAAGENFHRKMRCRHRPPRPAACGPT
jgi:hypothetical protein